MCRVSVLSVSANILWAGISTPRQDIAYLLVFVVRQSQFACILPPATPQARVMYGIMDTLYHI